MCSKRDETGDHCVERDKLSPKSQRLHVFARM
jgi:hypothetical protein